MQKGFSECEKTVVNRQRVREEFKFYLPILESLSAHEFLEKDKSSFIDQ